MHKNLTKQLFLSAGVRTPAGKMIKKGETVDAAAFGGYPLVIKPCSGGSSIGVSIAHDDEELRKALEEAFAYEDEILVEQYVSGRELTVTVLGSRVLPSVEIIPKQGFYDYKNKYQAGMTVDICPAEIPPETEKMLGESALKAFNALGLFGYARMDFILDSKGDAYCLEANTLPGMTPTSLIPQSAAAVGISYRELCEEIINISLKR